MNTYVYAISDSARKAVKFGRSINPQSRLKELQTASPGTLELEAYCLEWERFNERVIHRRMKKHRLSGEWFTLNSETRDMIDTIQTLGFVMDIRTAHA